MKFTKVERYYNRVRDVANDLARPMFKLDYDFSTQWGRRVTVVTLSQNLIEAQLELTPWYMPWRKAFLNLVFIHALQQRLNELSEYNAYVNKTTPNNTL